VACINRSEAQTGVQLQVVCQGHFCLRDLLASLSKLKAAQSGRATKQSTDTKLLGGQPEPKPPRKYLKTPQYLKNAAAPCLPAQSWP
jgi:hypothetical protein